MRMDVPTARRLFTAARVARLATADADGVPHVVPVTFAVDGDDVVWAVDAKPKTTTALRRLRNIAARPAVSLLVDHYAEDWSTLWWVRADGHATIGDPATDAAAVAALVAKYPQYGTTPPSGPVVRVRIRTWRGWSATDPPEPPGPARRP